MRYHYKKPAIYSKMYGKTLVLSHPVYSRCTIYVSGTKGMAVIQQRFDKITKKTWWSELDPWLTDALYLNSGFKKYFDEHAGECMDGLYPTVTIRQIMWALKMKPLKRERWETVFDRRYI